MLTRRVVVNIYQSENSGNEAMYTFTYPETNIMFRVAQTESDSPDNCFIKIDGISKETYGIFNTEKNKKYIGTQRVEVYYGYNSDLSLVFSGTVDRVMYLFNGGSQTLMMNISKNARKFNNMKRSISLSGEQTIKSAVDNICREFGYSVSYGAGNFDSINIGNVSYTGNFKRAMTNYLPKEYGFYTKENDVFVYSKDKFVPREIVVWPENGLLAYPTEDSKQEKTAIKTTLFPAVESGMKVNIPVDDMWFSDTDTGVYKSYLVRNYVSVFQNGIGTTDFECEGGLSV
ncbi:MAG: hypothetical protein ACRCX2_12670 [Paraclostridium sp.]